jgi:4-hydroxy-tetrahydrodipicolinate reductase
MKNDQRVPKVWIHGISGRMGQTLRSELSAKESMILHGGSDHTSSASDLEEGLQHSSLVIDFSSLEGNLALYEAFLKAKTLKGLSLVICSTGITQSQKDLWQNLSKRHEMSILFAPNTSLGILMMMKSALVVAGLSRHAGFDIEIEECHHRHKKDSPSGTSLFLAESLQGALPESVLVNSRTGARKENEIGLSVTRGGGVFGEHRIRFLGEFEEFTLSHRAFSRELFAKGALVLAEWLLKQKRGSYTLKDIDISQI